MPTESVGPPSIARLVNVTFEVADVGTSFDFYTRAWGLEGDTSRQEARLSAAASDEPILALHDGATPGLLAVQLELRPGADFGTIARAVESAGGAVHSAQGDSSIVVEDLDEHRIEITAGHRGTRSGSSAGSRPVGLDHVVLEVRDLDAATHFYREALGLRVSDSIPGFMTFLRCNENHHSIALRAGGTGVDHVAFTVPDWHAIAAGVYRLGDLGVERVWGPGRHGPGNNLFAYFKDPDGNTIEYTAEVQQVDDSWQPREWRQEQGDLWPTAG
jgi:catechol 2,3-dioxygenase